MRQDQYSVAVSLTVGNANRDFGVWDKLEGGEVDSEETKYKPGAMAPAVSLGGSVNVGNVTVSRLYDLKRDHATIGDLLAAVGKATVTVTKQPLDADGNTYGSPLVYTGKLKAITPPEVDSESSDAALIGLEVSTGGTVAVAG